MAATNTNVATVTAAATDTALLSANALRHAAPGTPSVVITNNSSALMYVLLGDGAASSTNFTYAIAGLSGTNPTTLEVVNFRGALRAAWASATGSAQITELL